MSHRLLPSSNIKLSNNALLTVRSGYTSISAFLNLKNKEIISDYHCRVRSLSPWERENSEVNPDIDPDELAQHVLQDLVSRATFGHIKAIMLPLLHYMDKGENSVLFKLPNLFTNFLIENTYNDCKQ